MKRKSEGDTASETEIRNKGICPHSQTACNRARCCGLGAAESCVRLIQNQVTSCASCRKRGGGCEYLCFREGRV